MYHPVEVFSDVFSVFELSMYTKVLKKVLTEKGVSAQTASQNKMRNAHSKSGDCVFKHSFRYVQLTAKF